MSFLSLSVCIGLTSPNRVIVEFTVPLYWSVEKRTSGSVPITELTNLEPQVLFCSFTVFFLLATEVF